jgi:hypothetical protein
VHHGLGGPFLVLFQSAESFTMPLLGHCGVFDEPWKFHALLDDCHQFHKTHKSKLLFRAMAMTDITNISTAEMLDHPDDKTSCPSLKKRVLQLRFADTGVLHS